MRLIDEVSVTLVDCIYLLRNAKERGLFEGFLKEEVDRVLIAYSKIREPRPVMDGKGL